MFVCIFGMFWCHSKPYKDKKIISYLIVMSQDEKTKNVKILVEVHTEAKAESAKDKVQLGVYVSEAVAYWNKNRWKHKNWRSYGR